MAFFVSAPVQMQDEMTVSFPKTEAHLELVMIDKVT